MADVNVTTETSVRHKHPIPEATVIAQLKLEVPNGATLVRAHVMDTAEGKVLLLETEEPVAVAEKIVTV